MNKSHAVLIIAAVAGVTILLRFLPFLIFGNRTTPKLITYLSKVLPYSVMGMLVVYCLKGATISAYPYALPEIIAGLTVVLLHIWKRNTLLSIVTGTVVYMVLVQLVFV